MRIELELPEVDTESVLRYEGPGATLGEVALLDRLPRSATAIADTLVRARTITTASLDELAQRDPAAALGLTQELARDATAKLRRLTEQASDLMFAAAPDPVVDDLVGRAVAAQAQFADWPEDKVDALLGRLIDRLRRARRSRWPTRRWRRPTSATPPTRRSRTWSPPRASTTRWSGQVGAGTLGTDDTDAGHRDRRGGGRDLRPGAGHQPGGDGVLQDAGRPQVAQRGHPQLPPRGARRRQPRGRADPRGAEGGGRSRGPGALGQEAGEPQADPAVHEPPRRRPGPRDRGSRDGAGGLQLRYAGARGRSRQRSVLDRARRRPRRRGELDRDVQVVRQRRHLRCRAQPRRRPVGARRLRGAAGGARAPPYSRPRRPETFLDARGRPGDQPVPRRDRRSVRGDDRGVHRASSRPVRDQGDRGAGRRGTARTRRWPGRR